MSRRMALVWVVWSLWAGSPVWAAAYGNPVSPIDQKELGLGVAFSDTRQTLIADYGLTESGTLRLLMGAVDLGRADGGEVGVGYRYRLGEGFRVGDETARMGLLATFRLGTVDAGGSSVAFNQIDAGFGAAITTLKNLSPYLDAIYRRVSADSEFRNKSHSKTESDVGFVIGAEFRARADILLGAEIHAGFEDEDFAVYGEMKF